MSEHWMSIVEVEGQQIQPWYEVSDLGRIKILAHKESIRRDPVQSVWNINESIMVYELDAARHELMCKLQTTSGQTLVVSAANVVATYFNGRHPKYKTKIQYVDGNSTNLKASNLQWSVDAAHKQTLQSNCNNPNSSLGLRCIESGQYFHTLSAAASAIGRSPSYIKHCIKSSKSCKDYWGNTYTLAYIGGDSNGGLGAHRPEVSEQVK